MVVACRGDGVEAVDGAEVDLSPEAAGPPEGGKVLGRGSAPMDAVLSIGPYDADQAAGVTSFQVYRCFVPLQGDATHRRESFCPTLLQLRAATRAVTREKTTSQGALEMYITKRPCKKVPVGNAHGLTSAGPTSTRKQLVRTA